MKDFLCRHCGNRKANRPGALCWQCYYTPGVRERFGIKLTREEIQADLKKMGVDIEPAVQKVLKAIEEKKKESEE
jgi:hypothetical protein